MYANLADLTDRTRESLDRDGIVCLDGVIAAKWLSLSRADVENYVAQHGPGDHDLVDSSKWNCPAVEAFASDPRVESFLDSLMPSEYATSAAQGYSRRVLRILDGTGGVHCRPYVWHYDGSAVTMIVPLLIPDDGSGQLAVFPNSRPHRRFVAVDVLEKVLAQTWPHARWTRYRFDRDSSQYTTPLVPGNAYVFRGYRSLHGTLPWPPGALRVTLVLQYGHPHGLESGLLRNARTARDRWRRLRGRKPAGMYASP